jgi:hypothetical protein
MKLIPIRFSVLALLLSVTSFAASVEEFATDYMRWNICGRPEKFVKQLDYSSFRGQRAAYIEMANADWDGSWGQHWRSVGVSSQEKLADLTDEEFWTKYYAKSATLRPNDVHFSDEKIRLDVHSVSEARGVTYVAIQVRHDGWKEREGELQVLRCIKENEEWRLLAFPGTLETLQARLALLRRQSASMKTPNKAPEPTPGSVTPRAPEGRSK